VPYRCVSGDEEHRGRAGNDRARPCGRRIAGPEKERLLPDRWPDWEAKTSYLPFAAIVTGRARLAGFGCALLGGLIVWLAATWAHLPLAGIAAGIWRWL
jgi:uncharacterized membrane protein